MVVIVKFIMAITIGSNFVNVVMYPVAHVY